MTNTSAKLPADPGLYYGGAWHKPAKGGKVDIYNPATAEKLTSIYQASTEDIDAVVRAAQAGFEVWRDVAPFERAKILREAAAVLRANARELALIDASDTGTPYTEMLKDVEFSAFSIDYFAGLISEAKGASVPMGPDRLSFSEREPYGVIARICPSNHPLIFTVGRLGAPLIAGNVFVVKPPEQAPLSALRAAELLDGTLPKGVFNVMPGDKQVSAALVAHPDIAMIAFTGSVAAGQAVMRSAADGLKRLMLELGGKNALVALPDADPDTVAQAVIRGMNFTWCSQSCGSTSRAFLHADIYEAVVAKLPEYAGRFRPGLPMDPQTTMGCLISRQHFDRVKGYIQSAHDEGARLICGGGSPQDEALQNGFFLEPTVFADVTMDMRIAREEIFGPVLSVLKWRDEDEMIRQVNQTEYGLTFSVWGRDITRTLRIARRAQAGFCWINEVGPHAFGASFGGYKKSGIGREESLEELIAYTQEKNILVNLKS
jgi:betaine-aldehyde dehydrogenase